MDKLGRLGACLVIAVLTGCAAEDEPTEPTEVGSNGPAVSEPATDPTVAAPEAANGTSCDPPWTVDAESGRKKYKLACM